MASLLHEKKHKRFRITYAVYLPSGIRYRSRYCNTRQDANDLRRQLEQAEAATRSGYGTEAQIEDWVGRRWLREEEAKEAFRSYREAGGGKIVQGVDLSAVRSAYEAYALSKSNAKDASRKSHKNHMQLADTVLGWLGSDYPMLDLKAPDIERWLYRLQTEERPPRYKGNPPRRPYSEWSIHHMLTKLRLLLDQAQKLGMIESNPARDIKLPNPKRRDVRRILEPEEARDLLHTSLEWRQLISGGLPTAVRLGLYAGLRDEEMCWLEWDWIDSRRRILAIPDQVVSPTGQRWLPKDAEARTLDIKQDLVDYLKAERSRQQKAGFLGRYILVAGDERKPQYRGQPLNPSSLTHAFAKMIKGSGLDKRITLYSLRHSYATALLRAGVDIVTVQERMGHSDIRTTRQYLHALRVDEHPTDVLPY